MRDDRLHQQVADLGSEQGEFLVGSARAGRPASATRSRTRHVIDGSATGHGACGAYRRSAAARRPIRAATSGATHSTWWVIGNASKARSAASRQPASRATRDVAGQRRRVARDVADRPRAPAPASAAMTSAPGPGARRVEHDHVRRRRSQRRPISGGVDPAPPHARPAAGRARLAAASATAVASDSMPTHPPGRADRVGEDGGERPGAGVQVEHGLARPRVAARRAAAAAKVGGGVRVHLPEPAGRDARSRGRRRRWCSRCRARRRPATRSGGRRPRRLAAGAGAVREHASASLVAAHHLDAASAARRRASTAASPTSGDAERAVLDGLDLVRAVPVQPEPAVGVDGVGDPGAPAEQAAGQFLDPVEQSQRRGRPAGRTARARPRPSARAGPRPAACCQSQPPQRPGPACGHGGSTRSGDGASTSTASARQNEPPPSSVTERAHPLAGQRVPDEHAPGPSWPGDAEPAVRDRRRPRARASCAEPASRLSHGTAVSRSLGAAAPGRAPAAPSSARRT